MVLTPSTLVQFSAGAANSALIKGGAGNDTINITDLGLKGSAGAVATTVKGGAGADVAHNQRSW